MPKIGSPNLALNILIAVFLGYPVGGQFMQRKEKKRNKYLTVSFVTPGDPKLEANWKVWGHLAKGWAAYSVAILTVTSHPTHDERLMTGLTPVNPNLSRAHALLLSTCAHNTY